VIRLDREGTIQSVTPAARNVLEYAPDAHFDECFFSHVHKRNLRRVMHDLADMVCRGKRRAQWLVRLRTGNNRWRWYRVAVQNRLGDHGHVRLRLRQL
jgi:PAS domain-containing protein